MRATDSLIKKFTDVFSEDTAEVLKFTWHVFSFQLHPIGCNKCLKKVVVRTTSYICFIPRTVTD
jgi:hypothetical protein